MRWAIDCNVDIISIGWTIEHTTMNREDMVELQIAISDAEHNGIVMFCSASDQGSRSIYGCYPADWERCISIGAATDTGERCA